MGYIIEITEDKHEKLSENMEKVLKYGGKVMQCIEEMKEESMGHRGGSMGRRYGDMGERDNYGNRGGYGRRDDDDDDPMGERRRRRSNGQYY